MSLKVNKLDKILQGIHDKDVCCPFCGYSSFEADKRYNEGVMIHTRILKLNTKYSRLEIGCKSCGKFYPMSMYFINMIAGFSDLADDWK